MTAFFLRYVSRKSILAYEALGWRVVSSLATSHHGVWSILMRWDGEDYPPEPEAAL